MNKLLFACLIAVGVLFAGCSKDSYDEKESDQSSIKVTIRSENSQTVRLMGNEPDQDTENTVHSFAVCIFNNTTGDLERHKVFLNTLSGTVDKLSTTTTKRVVVLVNLADYTGLGGMTNYSDLEGEIINLDSQIPGNFSAYGLFMSGEAANITLLPEQPNAVTIPVSRVVAKVRLGTLTITPDPGSSLSLLTLKGVCLQKVPYYAYMIGNDIPSLANDEYIGGLVGTTSIQISGKEGLLYENLSSHNTSQPITPEVYFYVFPNDNFDQRATLLTFHCTYNGRNAYYTFPINSNDMNGGDGEYIQRNKVYTLNVTLKDLNHHMNNPDEVSPTAILFVTNDVKDWEGFLNINTEW